MNTYGACETSRIESCSIIVHQILNSLQIPHVFLGGYQLVRLGAQRKSKDVDVEVYVDCPEEQYFYILEAFVRHPDMDMMDGNDEKSQPPKSHNIRADWHGIGIDILLRPTTALIMPIHPSHILHLPTSTPQPDPQQRHNHHLALTLPFLPLSNLLAEKVLCAGMRTKWSDIFDILFLTSIADSDNLQREFGVSRAYSANADAGADEVYLDLDKVCCSIPEALYKRAMRKQTSLVPVLEQLLVVRRAYVHEAASKRDREGYNYAASNVSLTDTDSGYAGSTYGDEETIYTLALSDASVGSTDTLVGTGPVPVWDGEELSWVYDDGVISPVAKGFDSLNGLNALRGRQALARSSTSTSTTGKSKGKLPVRAPHVHDEPYPADARPKTHHYTAARAPRARAPVKYAYAAAAPVHASSSSRNLSSEIGSDTSSIRSSRSGSSSHSSGSTSRSSLFSRDSDASSMTSVSSGSSIRSNRSERSPKSSPLSRNN